MLNMINKNTSNAVILTSRKRKRDVYENDSLISFLHFKIKDMLNYIEEMEKLMDRRLKKHKKM